MRVWSIYVTLAHGLGGFAQEASQTNRAFSTRRWTDGVVKEKVSYRAVPPHHFCSTVSPILRWGEFLTSFLTDVAGEHFLPAT